MKKTRRVTVRLDAFEYHRLCDEAAAADVSVSEFIRQALIRGMTPTAGSRQMIGKLGSRPGIEPPVFEETGEVAIGLGGWDDP